jgi:hypothetical protein
MADRRGIALMFSIASVELTRTLANALG